MTLRFSVLVASYNLGRFLPQAIESCLAQDYPPDAIEVVVVDDASSDDSAAVIRRFAASDPRVRPVFHTDNAGHAAAIASGVRAAKNELVCLLDADDWFDPSKLRKCAARLEELGAPEERLLLCHDVGFWDEQRGSYLPETRFQVLGSSPMRVDSLGLELATGFHPFSNPVGVVCTRSLLVEASERVLAADWRAAGDVPHVYGMLMITGRVHFLHETLGSYRIHGTNDSGGVEGDRFVMTKPWRPNAARVIAHCERMLDTLDLGEDERATRLAYLKRLESRIAVVARPPSRTPTVSALVFERAGTSVDASIASLETQSSGRVEPIIVREDRAGLAEALRAARGSYLALVDAGDVLDRHFLERHLDVHQHRALAMLTASDFRIVDGSEVVHAHYLAVAGVIRRPLELLPPFSVTFDRWPLGPTSGHLVRNTPLVALLFEAVERSADPSDLAGRIEWLVLAWAAMLGPAARMRECLLSVSMTATQALHEPSLRCARPAPMTPHAEASVRGVFAQLLASQHDRLERELGKEFCAKLQELATIPRPAFAAEQDHRSTTT